MIYLNGEFMPLEQARVPVLDRGFIFGDGVYEVIPVYGRRPYRLARHLDRLQYSLDGIRLANPRSVDEWSALIGEVVARQSFDDQAVYLQVTRGVAKRDHLFPAGVAPTVLVMSSPLALPTPAQIENGVVAVTAEDTRWLHCDLKTISLIGNVLMRNLAADRGAIEAVMFRDGWLTEASASNVCTVRGGRIVAPPLDNRILPGITYGAIYDLAVEAGIGFDMRPVSRDEVFAADEIWLTSSSKEVLAVTTLDGRAVAGGRPGPVFRRMHELFRHSTGRAS